MASETGPGQVGSAAARRFNPPQTRASPNRDPQRDWQLAAPVLASTGVATNSASNVSTPQNGRHVRPSPGRDAQPTRGPVHPAKLIQLWAPSFTTTRLHRLSLPSISLSRRRALNSSARRLGPVRTLILACFESAAGVPYPLIQYLPYLTNPRLLPQRRSGAIRCAPPSLSPASSRSRRFPAQKASVSTPRYVRACARSAWALVQSPPGSLPDMRERRRGRGSDILCTAPVPVPEPPPYNRRTSQVPGLRL